MNDADAFFERFDSMPEGKRFYRSFSKPDVDDVLSLAASGFEHRIFMTIKKRLEMENFKVEVDHYPFPCQMTDDDGRVRFTIPNDRNKGIPVAVLRTDQMWYDFKDLAPQIYSGFNGVIDPLADSLIDFIRDYLGVVYPDEDEYLNREGILWFFGLPCFNWETTLQGANIQVATMVGGIFKRSGTSARSE